MKAHKKEIDVLSWSWGTTQSSSTPKPTFDAQLTLDGDPGTEDELIFNFSGLPNPAVPIATVLARKLEAVDGVQAEIDIVVAEDGSVLVEGRYFQDTDRDGLYETKGVFTQDGLKLQDLLGAQKNDTSYYDDWIDILSW